jgi:hypothetical protein
MNSIPKYLTGDLILVGDVTRIGPWDATVELVVTQDNTDLKDAIGVGVMLVGPAFGRLLTKFGDEDLVLVRRDNNKK